MNSQQFDDLARGFSTVGSHIATRRQLLRWLTAGSVATLTGSLAAAGPLATEDVLAQSPPQRRAAGGPDIGAIAAKLEYDPQKIFRFVADDVRYDGYSGVLRGGIGTLWGMSGNSVDQALLLAEMLTQAQIETRLMVGQLTDASATSLAEAMQRDAQTVQADQAKRTNASTVVPVATPIANPFASPVATPAPPPGTPVTTLDQAAFTQRAIAMRPILIANARAELKETQDLLNSSLKSAGVKIAAPSLGLPALERSQHMWLQYANGPTWVDLDPSMPRAKPGETYAIGGKQLATLPNDLYHQVKVRVLADIVSGGQPDRQELLTFIGRSVDLVGVPVSFVQAKPQLLGQSITSEIAGQDQYVPYLQVGEKVTQGTPMTFNGQGGAAGALGGTSTREGEPVGEWLEVTLIGPDAASRVETREVFDRIGIDKRTPGADLSRIIATLPPVESTDLGGGTTIFLPLLTLTNIAVVSAAVPVQYFVQDYAIQDTAGDLAYQNHGYHYLRDFLGSELANETGLYFYHDRPAVTFVQYGLALSQGKQPMTQISVDLVHPTLAAIPLRGSSTIPDAGIVSGVMNLISERNLLETSAAAFPNAVHATFTNVGRIFEEAAKQQIRPRVIEAGASLPADLAANISGAARARIDDDLKSGFTVVVPEQAVTLNSKPQTGWWAVAPATGLTLDRMETGQGQELEEEATILDVIVHVIHEAYILTSCLISIGIAVGGVIVAIMGNTNVGVSAAVAGGGHAFAMCAAAAA